MKFYRNILLMTGLLIGFSMTALAQGPPKDPPPKKDPPVVVVKDKDKDKDKDKPKDDKNKKPGSVMALVSIIKGED